jgi:hypothetical protein
LKPVWASWVQATDLQAGPSEHLYITTSALALCLFLVSYPRNTRKSNQHLLEGLSPHSAVGPASAHDYSHRQCEATQAH